VTAQACRKPEFIYVILFSLLSYLIYFGDIYELLCPQPGVDPVPQTPSDVRNKENVAPHDI